MTTQLAKQQTTAQPTSSPSAATQLRSTVLANTVQAILSDSRQEAARYMDEVVVPREAGE
jgi:hypothetical protein